VTAAAGAEQHVIYLKTCADVCKTCLLAGLAYCCMQESLLLMLLVVVVLSCSTCTCLLHPASANASVLLLLARPRLQSCAALYIALLS
jgi:hypothetical protein